MSVASLLQQSRDVHQAYREALPRRIDGVVFPGDAEAAGVALATACRLRAEAHVLDPAKVDPAWGDEAVSHDHSALLDFYVKQLTMEPLPVQAANPVLTPALTAVAATKAPTVAPAVKLV